MLNICGSFMNGYELLQVLSQKNIDVVFLDIEMLEISGIELAKIINEKYPEILIVFVTAYEKYALEAFNVEVVDFLLKPIRNEHLERCIQRINKRKIKNGRNKKGKIICFQKFSIYGSEGEYINFHNSKCEELLAFLIHHQGQPVSKDLIIETLWEGKEYKKAMSTLYSTMYQLRKTLEPYQLDILIEQSKSGEGYYAFQLAEMELDVEEFTKRLSIAVEDSKACSNMIELYKGSYFEKNDYFWAQERRQQLENRFIKVLEKYYQFQLNVKNYQLTKETLEKLCQLRPFEEKYHVQMIDLYIRNNELVQAHLYKEKIEKMFKKELGITIRLSF